MSKLAFTLSVPDADLVSGTASKVVVRDSLTVLTLAQGHAPLVAALQGGEVSIFETDQPKVVTYQEGFITLNNGQCAIHLLR